MPNAHSLVVVLKVVDAQSPVPGGKSLWAAKGSKTPVKDVVAPCNPGPPAKLPKPSPGRNVQPAGEANEAEVTTGPGQEQANGTKRKLNLEVQIGGTSEGVTNPPCVDPTDSGVKVRKLWRESCT